MPLPAFPRILPLSGKILLLSLGLMVLPVSAQVPHILNYQGRIVAGGVNFDGTGKFKFALVGAGANASQTYWSHDGSSVGGNAPSGTLSLSVVKGLYAVHLGDPAIIGMAAIPSSVFTHSDVHLRVWFDDGVHGSQLMTPDQRIAAVGYAIMADTVTDGAITSAKIAPGAVSSAQLANGSVGTSHLATGAVTADRLATGAVGTAQLASGSVTAGTLAPNAALTNLQASGQTGVTSGGVVLSPVKDNPSLLAAGYTALPFEMPTDRWELLPYPDDPEGQYRINRDGPAAVWTGSEVIMWGGTSIQHLNTGVRFNPTTRTWSLTTTTGAPTGRIEHTMLWTGSLILIWGGQTSSSIWPNDGGIYTPALNTWSPITTIGAPAARIEHSAVWTGSEMIIWGGIIQSGNTNTFTNTGARYNPATNSWAPMSSQFAPDPRAGHLAVWTGTEMIVWGGYGSTASNNGARYNPASNTWTPMKQGEFTSPPQIQKKAHWTGTELIFVGSEPGCYNPATDSWRPISSTNQPSNTFTMSSVWTGSEVILWGPSNENASTDPGGRYDLVSDTWRPTTRNGSPPVRNSHTATWTGSQMMVLGGGRPALYIPGKIMYLYQKP